MFLLIALAGACGGSSGGSGQSGVTGEEAPKPGGGTFFVDSNQSGGGASMRLTQVTWGRLVNVHEVNASGKRVERPVFTDYLIEPTIRTDGSRYVVDRNPVTQRERLTILDEKGLDANDDPTQEDPFLRLLREASDALPVAAPKNDNGTSSPPFETIPRNGCVSLRFDDCLDDGVDAERNLVETVLVLSGYPPITPFSARIVFDPNHGAVVSGAFHSTRVLVDMTTSEAEAAGLPTAQDVNPIGLSASTASTTSTNVSIRVPTVADIGSGQFDILTNLAGIPLSTQDNGPVDLTEPTRDVVRAIRSGNSDPQQPLGQQNGFLEDFIRPRILGGWSVTVTNAQDAGGQIGFDFTVDLSFGSTCLAAPAAGDVVTVGSAFMEVTGSAALVGSDVTGLPVRSVQPVANPATLEGAGLYQAPFHPTVPLDLGCWVSFLPDVTTFPTTGVSTDPQIVARFNEPMDPASLSPFRDFLVVGGPAGPDSTAKTTNIVVGTVAANSDLTVFTFEPNSLLPHTFGMADPFHLELDDARDLAGNRLQQKLPFVDFTVDPLQSTEANGSIVLRFESNDEYAPEGGTSDGLIDLRGQFFYDNTRGAIVPRPVAFAGWPADRNNPVPMVMTAVGTGVFTPLNPLGAKLQTVWRYCDFGWNVRDETKYNLDVIGLNWSPIGGLVVADFYDRFEIRLGHSRFLPDDPCFPASGLPGTPSFFDDNYLGNTVGTLVHNSALGYTVNPANLFNAASGTPMMPYPLNKGFTSTTYTWRDTSILDVGGGGDSNQPGIPTSAEGVVMVDTPGSVAGNGQVPSFGLPLLIELRCHPSDRGLGLNRFDVSISNPAAPVPGFRAYTAGGINTLGNQVIVLPDSEDFPKGGFNPAGTPPGARTSNTADNVFYIGQLDTVVRVSRVHTVWLDVGQGLAPGWVEPVLEPSPADSALGTEVILDFRAATGFNASGNDPIVIPFDASFLDVYGNETTSPGVPQENAPIGLTPGWSMDPAIGDGRRYIQVRITFVNNIETGVSPELTALALPYDLP